MVDAVFDTGRYIHVLAGAGAPTLETTAGGPISAFVEAVGEATRVQDRQSPCAIRRIDPQTRILDLMARSRGGVIHPNLQHRKTLFELDGTAFGPFPRAEFGLDAAINLKSIAGFWWKHWMARHLPRSGNVTPIPCDYGESGRSDKSNRTWKSRGDGSPSEPPLCLQVIADSHQGAAHSPLRVCGSTRSSSFFHGVIA